MRSCCSILLYSCRVKAGRWFPSMATRLLSATRRIKLPIICPYGSRVCSRTTTYPIQCLWKDQDTLVAVRVHLIFDFPQPLISHSLNHIVTINMTEPILQNGILQSIVPSNAATRFHNETLYPSGSGDHGDHEPRTEKPSQFIVAIDILMYAAGLSVCLAVWRQAFPLKSSYRSLLRMARMPKAAAPFRGRNEYARNREGDRALPYEDIISKGTHFDP